MPQSCQPCTWAHSGVDAHDIEAARDITVETGVITVEQSPIITPSLELVASVHLAVPASTPPDELLSFTVPVHESNELIDWALTTDSVAFGDTDIRRLFDEWRSTWERSWMLDPLSGIERLVAVARDLRPTVGDVVPDAFSFVLDRVRHGERASMEPSALPALASALESLRDAIRELGRNAFGFVNATPGYEGTGLARAWCSVGGPEILASDHFLEVSMHPTSGLALRSHVDGNRYDGVTQVEVLDDRFECTYVDDNGSTRVVSLGSNHAMPIAWTMPNAMKWRVVQVPEVIAWARSISGLIDCCAVASTLGERAHFASRSVAIAGSTNTD